MIRYLEFMLHEQKAIRTWGAQSYFVQSELSDCQGNTDLKEGSADVDRVMRRPLKKKTSAMKMTAVKLGKALGTHRICNKIQTNE